MAAPLPALIDKAGLQAELGITPYEAERIMHWLPTVRPAAKRIYVRRADVERHLEAATVEKSEPKQEHVGVSAWIRVRTTSHGDKRYTVEYRLGGRATPKQNANTFRTLREAKQRRDLVAGWIAQGLNPRDQLAKLLNPDPASSLAAAFDTFISSRIDVTPKTLVNYRNAKGRIIPHLGHLPLDQITPGHIQDWIISCADLSPGTLKHYVGALRQVLDHAELEPNPARSRKIRLPRETGEEPAPPSSREWQLIREHINDPRKLLALRLIECLGLRIAEAMALTLADVDFHTGRLRVSIARTKGRTSGQRWLPVPAELLDEIRALDAAPARRIFTGLSDQTVRLALRTACVKAGVTHYSPHDLRHRRISLWIAHQIDPVTARVWAGHTKTTMTLDRYSHVMSEPHLDEWRTHWLDSYRAERLERHGVTAEVHASPRSEQGGT